MSIQSWRQPRRAGFWIKTALAAGLVVLGDLLFWTGDDVGGNLGVFAGAWLVATLLARPAIRSDRRAWIAAALAAVYAAMLFDDPGPLALALFGIAITMAALLPRVARFGDALAWGVRLVLHGLASLAGPLRDAARLRRSRRHGPVRPFAGTLALLVVPVLGGATFLTLFANANPIIGDALGTLRFSPSQASVARFVFWLVLVGVVWSTLRPRAVPTPRTWLGDGTAHENARALPGLSVASVTLSLFVFNALFALQNGLDIVFLWSGARLPDGLTLAAYAHRGAYALIATALLAGLFVLVALRNGSATAASPPIRRLVTAWTLQTIFLVASSIGRVMLYVDAYSLTRLRIAALAWMVLVAVGLALILWRLLRGRGAAWLLNANVAAAALVLSLAGAVDLGTVAAKWNVRHAREVGGPGAGLDLCYLQQLGGSSLTALAELERRPRLSPAFRDRVTIVRGGIENELRQAQRGGGWTARNARRLARAGATPARSGSRLGVPSVRDCDGRLLLPIAAPPPMTGPWPQAPSVGR